MLTDQIPQVALLKRPLSLIRLSSDFTITFQNPIAIIYEKEYKRR